MDYEQFVSEYTQELQLNMEQENVTLQRMEVQKINEKLDGLSIRYPDSPVAPTIYLNDKFQMMNDGYSVEELAENTAEMLRSIRSNAPAVPELTQEAAKKNLYLAVVNADENAELLKQIPHERLEDLAVIARFKVGEEGSFIVKNEMCQHLQMTSEEILEQAHKNTDRQEFQCTNMADVMKEIMISQGMPKEYVDELIETQGMDCPMYVLTNESKVEGAVAIASQPAMEKAFEKVKEDHPEMEQMYVLGSSRHELLLVPDSIVNDVEELKAMHKEVQDTELSVSDKLTEHIYKYDGLSKKLSIADTPALSESESVVKEVVKSHAKSH